MIFRRLAAIALIVLGTIAAWSVLGSLAITIGVILTLFVLMRMTARAPWEALFASAGVSAAAGDARGAR